MNTAFMISLAVPTTFIIMMILEPHIEERQFPPRQRWKQLGLVFFLMALMLGSLVPIFVDALALPHQSLFDLSQASAWWAFLLGLALTSLAHYLWHRAVHISDFLWRTTHQLHHSPQRVDVAGAFFSHPLEVIAKTLIALGITIHLLGLDPRVASAVSTFLVCLSIFQHWNIKTPRVLGYFIPRPEMHGLHHESGQHRRNYGDLPLWDLLFGTFKNPKEFHGEVGFAEDEAARLKDMLLMRNVT